MDSALIKRLFRAINGGVRTDTDVLCKRIVEDERRRGHVQIAAELEKILKRPVSSPPFPSNTGVLSQLPTSRRDSAPLFYEIEVEKLRHEMVLPNDVEMRFVRIEKEFAGRDRLALHGLRPRQRILMYGPPGCGKSLGAERLAWNLGLSLLKVRFDTLLSSYFGETLANLRKVFDMAEARPCALFLDECDSLARARTERNDIGEVNRITNALMEFLESYHGDGLVIAATNLGSALDPALFRRFDEVLKIPIPKATEITTLLRGSLSSMKAESGIDWDGLARSMDGMSCSEVVKVSQCAAKRCVMDGRSVVTIEDVQHSLYEIRDRKD